MSFSKNFYPTNRNEECFCGDKSGKCRHSKDDPNFKACMTFRDARLGQREGDWICVLEMAAEWSYWRLASSIELKSPEFREAAREAKKQQAVEKEKAKGFAIANELPAEQRHEQYSKIQSKKVLIPDHRENLLKRGFTLEQIIEIGYWSIRQPWEKVLGYYDTKLPGFVRFTEEDATLNAAVRAIVCPVRQLGQIVGLKMRLDDAPENGGRYRWLTGKTQKNPEGATPHIYGELPLAVLEATDPTKQGIWVTEGNEIKPVLVNYKLGYAVLGGGRFWQSSPNHAAKFLPIMRERYGNQITLCPDAGDILNKNVAPKWLSEYEFFKSQGFEVRFAWWGQTTKEHDDIDELENYDQIEFIDDTAFKALIEEHSETAKTAKKEWLDDYNEKQFHNWLDARKFDPDITIDDNDPNFKFPKNLPNEQAIISILSPMGTGKTHAMIEDIKTLESRTNKGAILIGYRNTLLKQTIQRALTVGVTIHLLKKKDSDDVQELLKTPYAHLACCLDSIFKLDGHFTGRDIYIDESCSVILHGLNGGTLKGRQAEILAMFKRAIQECNRIVLLDGNQSDFFTSIIAQIAPDKKVVKVLKKKQVVPQNFIFVETIGTSEEEIKKHDRSPLINIALQPNEKPFIFADSKVFTESLGRVLENEGKKGNVLNQNSVSEPWADLFLTDPNKFIEETQPDFQIISPSGESGLSVDIKNYFTCKLSFLSGVLTTNSQRQGLNRLRDTSVTHYVHCPERTAIRDHKIPPYYAAKQIHEVLTKRLNQSAILATHSADCKESATEIMMTQIEKSIKEDIFYEFSLKLFALENFERNNLRKCLMYTLKEEGHTVELVKEVSCKATNDKTEEAKEEYLEEEAAAIFKAQPLEEEEFKKYEKDKPNREIGYRVEKTRLLKALPGIENEEFWKEKFVLDYWVERNKDKIYEHENFFFLNNFEIAEKKHEVNSFFKFTAKDFNATSVIDTKFTRIKALKDLNVLQFVEDLNRKWTKESPEVIAFYKAIKASEQIQIELNYRPPQEQKNQEEYISCLRTALKWIGIKLKKGRDSNGKRAYFYVIDEKHFKSPERLGILRAMESKHLDWMASDNSQVSWISNEKHAQNLANKFRAATEYNQVVAAESEWHEKKRFNQDGSVTEKQASYNRNIDAIIALAWSQLSLEEHKQVLNLKPKLESVEAILTAVDNEICVKNPQYYLDFLRFMPKHKLWELRLNNALELGIENAIAAYKYGYESSLEAINKAWGLLSSDVQQTYIEALQVQTPVQETVQKPTPAQELVPVQETTPIQKPVQESPKVLQGALGWKRTAKKESLPTPTPENALELANRVHSPEEALVILKAAEPSQFGEILHLFGLRIRKSLLETSKYLHESIKQMYYSCYTAFEQGIEVIDGDDLDPNDYVVVG